MKARTIALVWLLAAVTLCAQTTPPSQKVAPAAAKPAAAPAKPAAAPAPSPFGKPAAAKPAAPAPAKSAPTATAQAKPAPAKPAAAKARPAPAKPAKPAAAKATPVVAKKATKNKRDPFVSPIVKAEGPGGCATGKKCLAIDSIVLKGIVKSQVGMIAVVESSARRVSYFLRENDPVFNGYVVKITRDSVTFRENVLDSIGRQSTREVVKTVIAPVV